MDGLNRNNKQRMTIEQLNAQYGKIPPQAPEVEEAVLGALMLEQDSIHKVNGILTAESFYKEEHQKIFSVIKSLSEKSKPIDLITVTILLKDLNQLDEVGGPVYITQLTSRTASAAHIEFHARIIAQKFMQRELIRISSETQTEAYDDTLDFDDLIVSLKNKISLIEDMSSGSNTGKSQSDVIARTIIEIEKDCILSESGKIPGIPTGLKVLDRATGGWRNTNLIVIGSRPKVGKTSLALKFTLEAAKAGFWVNYYGLEMADTDLMRINLASESEVGRSGIRDGKLEEWEWEKLNRACVTLEKLPIIWDDFAGMTAEKIKSNTIQNKKRGKCDFVVVDYLQLLKPFDKKGIREQQISLMSRTLKEIALDQKIPVMCLSQLSRLAAGVKPELHHLRESGAIEQDADIVIFPWKDEDEKFYLSISANRRGITGDFEIVPNAEMTRFMDIISEEYDSFQNNMQPNTSFYEKDDVLQNKF